MFDIFKKLSWFFKAYWKRYTLAIITIILASSLNLVPPKILGYVIDEIRFDTLTMKLLVTISGLYVLMIIFVYIVSFLWSYTLFGSSIILERIMRSKLMGQFLKMTPTFFGKFKTGDLMARSTNDLRAINETAGFGILTLVDSIVLLVMVISIMGFSISWPLTLAALIPLPLMAFIINKYGAEIHRRFMKAQTAFGNMNNEVLESIRGFRVVRAFVQEEQDAARFSRMTDDVYEKNMDVARIDALFEPTMNLLVGICYTIGLGYGSFLVFETKITLGDLVTFNMYLGMLIWPMFAIGQLINILQRGNASYDRVNEVLSYKADVTNVAEPIHVSTLDEIKFTDVKFSYPQTKETQLAIADLRILSGETVGIVGKTGAGKTTLFKLMLREYPNMLGDIAFANVPISELNLEQLRAWIGYVPQDQVLFSKSIRENIRFGKADATDEEIHRVMELAHFLDDIKQLPNGLDTEVGESGVTLSGGQKQRVALARAFIKDAEVLILDDSLSAVDGKTEANIIEHLRKERAGKTTLIAAHRLSAVTHADNIIVLEDGQIAESGTHEELISLGGWYKEQYEQQQLEG